MKLQNDLTFDKLLDWNNPHKMDKDEIVVMLPKFKMENNYDFTGTLGGMGMVDALKANFSGITEKNDLDLSKVVQIIFIEVNREVTEAAAATAITMRLIWQKITMQFVADHPFLFFIRHNKTRNILFFGSFSSP
uniref:Serpin B6 n=1 Tax=Callorhinchus milii TaxID=7868 RepID=A0A4W3KJ17_CALMI